MDEYSGLVLRINGNRRRIGKGAGMSNGNAVQVEVCRVVWTHQYP